jgi:hypothetical protein
MRRALLVSAFVLAALSCATPQAPPDVAPPEWAGFSSERLARLSASMQEFEADERISGVVTLVWREGVVVHSDVLGYQDVETKIRPRGGPRRRDDDPAHRRRADPPHDSGLRDGDLSGDRGVSPSVG